MLRAMPPVEPKNLASPKAKIPPSEATSQVHLRRVFHLSLVSLVTTVVRVSHWFARRSRPRRRLLRADTPGEVSRDAETFRGCEQAFLRHSSGRGQSGGHGPRRRRPRRRRGPEGVLRDLIDNQGNGTVVVDLRYLAGVDASLADVFSAASAWARRHGARFGVHAPPLVLVEALDPGVGIERRILRQG